MMDYAVIQEALEFLKYVLGGYLGLITVIVGMGVAFHKLEMKGLRKETSLNQKNICTKLDVIKVGVADMKTSNESQWRAINEIKKEYMREDHHDKLCPGVQPDAKV